jgi:hypothetical protein
LSISSCINLKVKSHYKKYNPYKVGDILVFNNSNKSLDTLFIISVEEDPWPRGGLPGPFIASNSLSVYGVWRPQLDKIKKGKMLKATSLILSIHPKRSVVSNTIDFSIRSPTMKNLGRFKTSIDSLVNERTRNDLGLISSYNDLVVLKISPKQEDYDDQQIVEIVWSLSSGYIRIKNKKGELLELVEK